MEIQNLLSPADVMLRLRVADKTALLRQLVHHLASRLELDAREVLDAVLRREGLGSTGMGERIAIPHARLDTLDRPAGALAILAQPVDFDAIDGQRVDTVFLLLLPGTSQIGQLNALSCVARRLRDPNLRAGLRRAKDSAAAYQMLASADAPTDGSGSKTLS
ncbi:PTS sugar transporter subunit IIA [Microvirga sp. 2TAF3]|uniref:PTS sugar transporter subunit IIA n=1 Tax=Microvirga sp. 2TAF3 TaxID=3233014 RepID=UPI003F9E4033